MMVAAVFAVFFVIGGCRIMKSDRDLISDLFNGDYNKMARPRRDPRQPLAVELIYFLKFVEELNEREQYMKTYGWLRANWVDDYLAWDPELYNNITRTALPGGYIWKPDFVIRNSVGSSHGEIVDEDEKFGVEVDHNGTVMFATAGQLKTACQVDMTYFPLDSQACYIHIDIWTASPSGIRVSVSEEALFTGAVRASGEWTLVDSKINVSTTWYGDRPYDQVKFIVFLDRKPAYYLVNIMAPCLLLSLLVLLVFLLPADSGEKVGLCTTLLLSFSFFLLLVADIMPRTSDSQPIVGLYLVCTMTLAACSLACTTLVLHFHHVDPDRELPAFLKRRFSCCGESPTREASRAQQASHSIDGAASPTGESTLKMAAEQRNANTGTEVEPGYADPRETNDSIPLQKALYRSIVDLNTKLETGRHHESYQQKWVHIARVMDRIFLVIFLLITITSVIVVLGIYPMTRPSITDPVTVT